MNRLIHIILLMSILPAFFMPNEVIVCLTNGVGDTCCFEESGGCSIRGQRRAKEPCCPEDVSSCQSDNEDREKLPIVATECSCCVVIKNSQESLDQTRLVSHLALPPATVSFDTTFAFVTIVQTRQTQLGTIHDPPRRLPLVI